MSERDRSETPPGPQNYGTGMIAHELRELRDEVRASGEAVARLTARDELFRTTDLPRIDLDIRALSSRVGRMESRIESMESIAPAIEKLRESIEDLKGWRERLSGIAVGSSVGGGVIAGLIVAVIQYYLGAGR